jgi:Fic family protein
MDITQSPAGNIVLSPQGSRSFVPLPLPPKLELDYAVINSLSRADFFLGKLAHEARDLPNPHLLIRPFVAREAVLSSRIEGTQATLGEILSADAGISTKQHPDDLQEVQNYIKALDYGLHRLETLPLSLRLIQELHAHLMQGATGSHAAPGEFRKIQNWIGPPGSTIYTAKFVPPPPNHLMDCLGDLEKFLHDRSLPPLIHAALCHYQFEAIHPFLDGNGRVGRLLIILLLAEQNILPKPLLYLSAFFEATRDEYYRQLHRVSADGAWNGWLVYFLSGVALQAEDALSRAERINGLLDQWTRIVASSGSQVAADMVRHLAVNPYVTSKKSAEDLGIAYSTAKRAVQKLAAAGIIQQTGGHKRDRVYCATAILSVLEESPKIR